MNNTTIIDIFNSSNSNIAYIKRNKTIARIAYKILKLESMIKKPKVASHAFFSFCYFQ